MKKIVLFAISALSAFETMAAYKENLVFSYIASGNVERVRACCDAEVAVKPNSFGEMPIFLAVAGNDVEVLAKIVSKIEDKKHLNDKDKEGNNVINIAAKYRAEEALKWLLDNEKNNIDLDNADNLGMTPLMAAAADGDFSIIQLLVEAGAGLGKADSEGNNFLHLLANAKRGNLMGAFKWLVGVEGLAAWYMTRHEISYEAARARSQRELDLVKNLAYQLRDDCIGELLRTPNFSQKRPIDVAAAAGNWEIVDILWDETFVLVPGQDNYDNNIDSLNRLLISLFEGSYLTSRSLRYFDRILNMAEDLAVAPNELKKDPDSLPQAIDMFKKRLINSSKHGATALGNAISSEFREGVDRLLEEGAELSRDELSEIIKSANVDMLKHLFEHNVFKVDSENMLSAVEGLDSDLVKLFISWLEEDETIDAKVIYKACECFGLDIIEPLLEHCSEELNDGFLVDVALRDENLLQYFFENRGMRMQQDNIVKFIKDGLSRRSSVFINSLKCIHKYHASFMEIPYAFDDSTFYPPRMRGRIDMDALIFLIDNGYITMPNAPLSIAIFHGSVRGLEIFFKRGMRASDKDIVDMIGVFDPATLQVLSSKRSGKLPADALTKAIAIGDAVSFRILMKHGVVIGPNVLSQLTSSASAHNFLDTIKNGNIIRQIIDNSKLSGDILRNLIRLYDNCREGVVNPYGFWIELVLQRLPIEERLPALAYVIEHERMSFFNDLIKDMNAEHLKGRLAEYSNADIVGVLCQSVNGGSNSAKKWCDMMSSLVSHGAVVSKRNLNTILDRVYKRSLDAKIFSEDDIHLAEFALLGAHETDATTLKHAVKIGKAHLVDLVIQKLPVNKSVSDALPGIFRQAVGTGDCDMIRLIAGRLIVTQELIDAVSRDVDMGTLLFLTFRLREQEADKKRDFERQNKKK